MNERALPRCFGRSTADSLYARRITSPDASAAIERGEKARVRASYLWTSGADSAQKQPKIVPVGRLHDARGVARRLSWSPNHLGQPVQCARRSGWSCRYGLFWAAGPASRFSSEADTDEFVEADRNGLAQVHRGLARVGRDFDEQMAIGQIFARKAMFFRAKDKGDAAAAWSSCCDQLAQEHGAERRSAQACDG